MRTPTIKLEMLHDLVRTQFKLYGEDVHTETWQSVDISKRPEARMKELTFVSFQSELKSEDLGYYRAVLQPNIPWADDHFEERVCGQPLNPGEQWAKWPWGNSANQFRDEKGQFNHNYMERYWPAHAGYSETGALNPEESCRVNLGIRGRYGDLQDMIELLLKEPKTRQAYLPVWFPEDTGIANPGRKPCTLGYHFLLRNRKLNVTYYIRSCDYYRHFADDVYMTIRLLVWVIKRCREKNPAWLSVTPGLFRMDIGSLHMFVNDYRQVIGEDQS